MVNTITFIKTWWSIKIDFFVENIYLKKFQNLKRFFFFFNNKKKQNLRLQAVPETLDALTAIKGPVVLVTVVGT